MSHKLYFSLISMSFQIEDFFKTGLPPSVPSTDSKNRLKLPPRIIVLFSKSSNVCSIRFIFSHVETSLFLVFVLYRLIKMETQSSIIASNIKKGPFSLFFFFKNLKDLFPVQPIVTPHELVFPSEKKSSFVFPFHSIFITISLLYEVRPQCRCVFSNLATG